MDVYGMDKTPLNANERRIAFLDGPRGLEARYEKGIHRRLLNTSGIVSSESPCRTGATCRPSSSDRYKFLTAVNVRNKSTVVIACSLHHLAKIVANISPCSVAAFVEGNTETKTTRRLAQGTKAANLVLCVRFLMQAICGRHCLFVVEV